MRKGLTDHIESFISISSLGQSFPCLCVYARLNDDSNEIKQRQKISYFKIFFVISDQEFKIVTVSVWVTRVKDDVRMRTMPVMLNYEIEN